MILRAIGVYLWKAKALPEIVGEIVVFSQYDNQVIWCDDWWFGKLLDEIVLKSEITKW